MPLKGLLTLSRMGGVESKRRARSRYLLGRAQFEALVLSTMYVYLSFFPMLLRLAVSTSGKPSEDCPDIADKLTLRLAVCQDVSVVSGLLVVEAHVGGRRG